VADVIFVLVIVAFFALSALFVRACDHIIGADDATSSAARDAEVVEAA